MPAPFASKYVDLNGTVLHYLHTGPTTLPGLPPALDRGALFLLVHGRGRNAGDWKRQLVGLGAAHGVVAVDLPAHGRSPGVEGLESVEEYADLLGRFAGAVLRRKPVLVGACMGCSVALVLAAHHPERLAGLVLLSGPALRPPDPALVERVADVVRGRLPQQFDALFFSPSTPMDVMKEAWMEQVKTDPRVLHGDLVAAATFEARPLLSRVGVPTLVLHGADDRVGSLEDAQAVAAAIPGARLEVIDGAGFVAQLERAERVNELLAEFARGLA